MIFFPLCIHAYVLWVEPGEIIIAQALLTCTSSLFPRQTPAIRRTKLASDLFLLCLLLLLVTYLVTVVEDEALL